MTLLASHFINKKIKQKKTKKETKHAEATQLNQTRHDDGLRSRTLVLHPALMSSLHSADHLQCVIIRCITIPLGDGHVVRSFGTSAPTDSVMGHHTPCNGGDGNDVDLLPFLDLQFPLRGFLAWFRL